MQERALRIEYEAISAIKIFSAFLGVVAFLILAVIVAVVVDNHPLPLIAALLNKYASHAKSLIFIKMITLLFGIGIFVHYWRIFCGISYTDHDDAHPEEIEHEKLLFERLTRMAFLVTYPVLSALLKTEYAGTALFIWALQVILMLAYDAIFWSKLWSKEGPVFGFALVNDFITAFIIAIYWKASSIEEIANSDDAAVFLLLGFTFLAVVIGVVETFTMYRKGLLRNFSQVAAYVRGA